jgi:hypothetical protein
MQRSHATVGSVFHFDSQGAAIALGDEYWDFSLCNHAQKQKELRCFGRYDMSTAKWKI